MTGINPVNPMEARKMGSFDFPVLKPQDSAPDTKPNVDPKGTHPHVEAWFGKLGTPPMEQGWPVIMETVPEVEDPNVEPWIDMIIDEDKPAVIFHTGRLSGSMALELADETHLSRVIVTAVPIKGGSSVELYRKEQALTPNSPQANKWYWKSANELVQTIRVDIKEPSDTLKVGNLYNLVVEWEFFHKIPGQNNYHCEPFCGFDDSITFKVGHETVV